MARISYKELVSLVDYNPDTGLFVLKRNGKVLGKDNGRGYIRFQINKKRVMAHTMAWLYTYGKYPENMIDHINQNKQDNRICNLRDVTNQVNQRNALLRGCNLSGQTGVYWSKKANKWQAYIKVDGSNVHLGLFSEFSDAVNARKNAEVLYGFHENHGKVRN